MKTYKSLLVWQKSIDLVEVVYRTTQNFPDSEKFGLLSQMRRCAVSIPSNIAEGHDRRSNKEFAYFLKVSFASSSELETQLIIALRLKLITKKQYDELTEQITYIRKMLSSLLSRISSGD